jgi:uncharacterized damage-inducible protein DinB
MNKHLIISPPKSDEYPEEFDQYIELVPSDDLLQYFNTQQLSVASLVAGLSEDQLLYRYAEGKWSVKDIFCHLIDCERIYNYRALCIARGDKTAFPGFEENDYVATAHADSRDITSIVAEYKAVRSATIELYKSFDDLMLLRSGIANNSKRSVRAIGYSLAGHELHHLNVIKERYLA